MRMRAIRKPTVTHKWPDIPKEARDLLGRDVPESKLPEARRIDDKPSH